MTKIKDGYAMLGSAVIKTAVEDWKKAKEKLELNPTNIAAQMEFEDLQRFFSGDDFEFYCTVCDMDPQYIRERIKEVHIYGY